MNVVVTTTTVWGKRIHFKMDNKNITILPFQLEQLAADSEHVHHICLNFYTFQSVNDSFQIISS